MEKDKKCTCGKMGMVARGRNLLCRKCFVDIFEKNVKRAIKEYKLKKTDKILVIGPLAAYLVKELLYVPAKFEFSAKKKNGDHNFIITEWTQDDECIAFLKAFADGGKLKTDKKVVKALLYVRDSEALAYAEIKKISFEPNKKDSLWKEFLDSFADHPEMIDTLLRNAKELGGFLR